MSGTEADFHHFQTALNVALGVSNRLAVLASQQFCKAVIFSFDEFKELAQNANAALRVCCSPCWLSRLSVFDRCTYFIFRGECHSALNRAVKRLKNISRTTAFAGYMLAANEMSYIAHENASRCLCLWLSLQAAKELPS